MQYVDSKKRFIRRAKPIRIIGDPDKQRLDKWNSTALAFSNLQRRETLYTLHNVSSGRVIIKQRIVSIVHLLTDLNISDIYQLQTKKKSGLILLTF